MERLYLACWKQKDLPSRLLVYARPDERFVCIQELPFADSLSFLKLDRGQKLLYTLSDGDPEVCGSCGGVLSVWRLMPDGRLTLMQKTSTCGAFPIDLALRKDTVALVNHGSTTNRICRTVRGPDGTLRVEWVYDEASLALFRREADGRIGPLLDLHRFTGHGEIPFFQESAAPHSLFNGWEDGMLLVPQRGTDRTSLFSVRGDRLQEEAMLPEEKGCGPRNAVMTRDGRHVYVLDEIRPVLSHYVLPGTSAVEHVPTVSPERAARCNADCRLFTAPHPVALWLSEDERFLYTLTRSTDTLAVFARGTDGGLRMIQEWKLAGENPRQVLRSGAELYVVLMDSCTLQRLRVDEATGLVAEESAVLSDIPSIAVVDGY